MLFSFIFEHESQGELLSLQQSKIIDMMRTSVLFLNCSILSTETILGNFVPFLWKSGKLPERLENSLYHPGFELLFAKARKRPKV